MAKIKKGFFITFSFFIRVRANINPRGCIKHHPSPEILYQIQILSITKSEYTKVYPSDQIARNKQYIENMIFKRDFLFRYKE